MLNFLILVLAAALISDAALAQKMTEDELRDFLDHVYEQFASASCTKQREAKWNYQTDINNSEKADILLNVTLQEAVFKKDTWTKYFKDLDPEDYQDEKLKREVKCLKIIESAALDEAKLSELTTAVNKMTNIYSTARICPYANQNCNLSTDGITEFVPTSLDYDELLYAWVAWRNASGAQMKSIYPTYVNLSNEAAVANGFKDKGELWRFPYESETFVEDIDALWDQIEPLYKELHTYVGNKLQERFGDKFDWSDGLLPVHIVTDSSKIAKIVKPYPNASTVDLDYALEAQNYSAIDMFETSDHFYQSMGLLPNGICYNTSAGAMIEKPTDGRDVVCHPNAWDFCDGQNYRIKMCTSINSVYFTAIHHEMGHIQYYEQYAKLPIVFRNGANPGFHEAIGDTIALSVSTPKHLAKIGLLESYEDNKQSSVNALMDMAVQKIFRLPFYLLIDKWRWDVFAGTVPEDQWNSYWWELRAKYQKLKPPVERSDSTDIDPGEVFHVSADSHCMAYFVAHILQFQIYKSLCVAAGEYDPDVPEVPLHSCDFYESVAAGDKLSAGLKLGSSVHWSEVLEVMTGEKAMNAAPLLEYFDPLYQYLKEENVKSRIC